MLPTKYIVVLSALGGWAAFNGVLFAVDSTKRYRAESGWILLAVALVIIAVVTVRKGVPSVTPTVRASLGLPLVTAAVALVSAVLLYHPALSVGLLSDDYVLLNRAQRGLLADPSWEYLRPLTLALWRVIALEGDSTDIAWRLHAFSITLHGLNAALVAVLATRLGLATREAVIAGALFLAFPGSAEAVVWASASFDLTFVLFMLTAGIVITTSPGVTQVVGIAVLTIAALASKEVGVVLPIVVAITAWASPHSTLKQALVPVTISLAIALIYGLIRVVSSFGVTPPLAEFSGYAVKEIFSRPFGFLGLPFHAQVLVANPWLAVASALWWPVMFVGAARRWSADGRDARLLIALGLWIVVTVVPLASMLFVSDDLQGSRYLYAGSAAWAILTVTLLRWLPNRLADVLVGALLVGFVLALRVHLDPWLAAAAERDRVLALFQQANLGCSPTSATELPDHVQGAYVFRNGFREAVSTLAPSVPGEPCVVEWSNDTFRRIDVTLAR